MRTWFFLMCLVFLLAACGVGVADQNNRGNELLEGGDVDAAVLAYQMAQVAEPDLSLPYYNAAAALSDLREFEDAEAALLQALIGADEELAAQAYYNLGEVYFRRANYLQAITAYQQVLLLRSDDEDARYNLELALSRLPTPTPFPDDTDDRESVPTPTPSLPEDSDEPTPSPMPEGDQGGQPTATPEESEAGGNEDSTQPTLTPSYGEPLSPEEAEQFLDAVQQEQGILGVFESDEGDPGTIPERDW